MSSRTERLQILITADTKGAVREVQALGKTADRDLSRASKSAEGFAASADRVGKRMVTVGAQVTAGSAVAAAGLYKVAKAASDLGEAQSAANVIFGKGGADAVTKFSEGALKSAGLSKRAATEFANNFATLGKAGGLDGSSLVEFSTSLTQLAGDLASFKNTSTDDAATALAAGLRGESEPLRRYGILLDDLTLRNRAAALGISEFGKQLTPQQKVLAAQAEILAQTSDAQGDFVRTSDGMANSIRAAAAAAENAKAGFGEAAAPAVAMLAEKATSLVEAFNQLPDGIKEAVGSAAVLVVGLGLIGGPVATGIGLVTSAITAIGPAAAGSAVGVSALVAPLGLAAVAIAGFGAAWAQTEAQQNAALDAFSISAEKIGKAVERGSSRTSGIQIGAIINKSTKAGPFTATDKLKDAIGIFDDAGNRAELSARQIEELKDSLDSLSRTDARKLLNDVRTGMILAGSTAGEADEALAKLYAILNKRPDAKPNLDETAKAMKSLADRTKEAASAGETFAQKYKAIAEAQNNPARIALAANAAARRLEDAKKELNAVDDPRKRQRAQEDALDSVSSAQDRVTDAIERRRKAQKELDSLTKRSVVAGSVPLVQEITKAAGEAVKEAQAQADRIRAEFGAGSQQDIAAQNVVSQARGREGKTSGLLNSALAEQAAVNAEDIRAKSKEVKDAGKDIAKSQRDLVRAEEDYADAIASSEVDRRQAVDDVISAQLDFNEAMAALKGSIEDGDDPMGSLAKAAELAGIQAGVTSGIVGGLTGALEKMAPALQAIADIAGNVVTASSEGMGVAQREGIPAYAAEVGTGARGGGGAQRRSISAEEGKRLDLTPPVYIQGILAPSTGDRVDTSGHTWTWDQGKKVWKYADGGFVPGIGSGDTVPAMLTPGEFVINKRAAAAIGTEELRRLNKANVQRFALGGPVASSGQAPVLSAGSSMGSGRSSSREVNVSPVFNITATEPKATAAETVRRLRSATFLAGLR